MRTRVTPDDDTAALVRQRTRERGVSFEEALNDAIRAGAPDEAAGASRTETAGLGVPTVDLDRTLRLAGELVTYDTDFGRFPGVAWRTPATP